MKARPFFLLAGGLLIGIGLSVLILLSGSSTPPGPEIGKTLQDMEFKSLAGPQIRLTQYKGQPVLINFWATWCGPCKDEMPLLNTYFQKFGSKIVFLGVNLQEDPGTVLDFVLGNSIQFPILLDSEGQTIRDYRLRGFPTTFFVDSEGLLQAIHIGSLTEESLDGYLRQMGVMQ